MERKYMAKSIVISVPHDWTFANWPLDVYPYDGGRGRHVVREHQDELVKRGALSRIGKSIIVFGAPYVRWLQANADRVVDFDVPANRPEHAQKRGGNAGAVARAASDSKQAP
jgi:hypothetical protein